MKQKLHVGTIPGTYKAYCEFRKKHPTYETVKSDYIKDETSN